MNITTAPTTASALNWMQERDDYGRTVHHLYVGARPVGVVIKHPHVKVGQPGSYWWTRWDMAYGSDRDAVTNAGRSTLTNLNAAKAALIAEIAANPAVTA